MTITTFENSETLAKLLEYPSADTMRRSVPLLPEPICGVLAPIPLPDVGEATLIGPAAGAITAWIRSHAIAKHPIPAGHDRFIYLFEYTSAERKHSQPNYHEQQILSRLDWESFGRKRPCIAKELHCDFQLCIPLPRSITPVRDVLETFDASEMPLGDWVALSLAQNHIDCGNVSATLTTFESAMELAELLGFENVAEMRVKHEIIPDGLYGYVSDTCLEIAPCEYLWDADPDEVRFGPVLESLRQELGDIDDGEMLWPEESDNIAYFLSIDRTGRKKNAQGEPMVPGYIQQFRV